MTVTDAQQRAWGTGVVADGARTTLAAKARDVDELRELGLMLGLFTTDQHGAISPANPLDEDVRLSRLARTRRVTR
ncbi:hypothetical protein [Amycolatopsis sp. TNS106]|uniref:hypothetical protein n=1 Tax=Amycolatopsis sp. TNS106 TaxID=2861750 RepID=UPI001C5939FD|nr:hypothetical protein [Amycolatopsis sp. TNS106]QXV57404.1 hypothetical protein CVV72_10630 [Amycolatopsis sp. TNS106]